MDSYSLLQGIFPTQGSNLGLPPFQADSLPFETPGKPGAGGIPLLIPFLSGQGLIVSFVASEFFVEMSSVVTEGRSSWVMVVCKEEGGKEKGKSSRLQAFCGCVLGGIAAQLELYTYIQKWNREIFSFVLHL